MDPKCTWDWEPGVRVVSDLRSWDGVDIILPPWRCSPDGERIAAIGMAEGDVYRVLVNGSPWDQAFDRAWSLQFSPSGDLICLAQMGGAWRVFVDGNPWEGEYEFLWDLTFDASGSSVALIARKGLEYSVVCNGMEWQSWFPETRDLCVAHRQGRTACVVQTERILEGDIDAFFKGVYTVAVNGVPWPRSFVNVWDVVMSEDGEHSAAEVRLDRFEYTIAVDGHPWTEVYSCVWEPVFRPGGSDVIAPVKGDKGWTLAKNAEPIWDINAVQLWYPTFSSDGRHIAAAASLRFGHWDIVLDGRAVGKGGFDALMRPVLGPSGRLVAAASKKGGKWGVCVNGSPWEEPFDMLWDPHISPDEVHISAIAKRGGGYYLLLDGEIKAGPYDFLWAPVFDDEGDRLLLRYVRDHRYCREVMKI